VDELWNVDRPYASIKGIYYILTNLLIDLV